MMQHETLFAARATGDGDGVLIVLEGELDLVTVANLAREVDRVAHVAAARTLIDVTQLTFCDLPGQRALLALVRSGASLCGRPPRCLRVLFEFTGHGQLLPECEEPDMVGADR
jgi:anti-anti-sigma regulatory factor